MTQRDAPFLAVVWFGSPARSPSGDRAGPGDFTPTSPRTCSISTARSPGWTGHLGSCATRLAKLGIRDNTILWYCSDNGALAQESAPAAATVATRADIYEGGLLVPAILEWPAKITQPRSTDVRCNTCDIYPTLLEIVGVTVEEPAPAGRGQPAAADP